MLLKGRACHEAPLADGTLILLLASVHTPVLLERGGLPEGLATLATCVRLLPSVCPVMHFEATLLAEGLATVLAHVRLLPGVRPLV